MRHILRHPAPWFAAFVLWFATLWQLSSQAPHFPPGLSFRLSDKILHFGYFFGGGILFASFLFRLTSQQPAWPKIVGLTVTILALSGGLDEWHQSMVPFRSGNDPGDFTADVLGALCGALLFRKFHRLLE
jgi:VanZ family protein